MQYYHAKFIPCSDKHSAKNPRGGGERGGHTTSTQFTPTGRTSSHTKSTNRFFMHICINNDVKTQRREHNQGGRSAASKANTKNDRREHTKHKRTHT